jgi:hypothetical protein
MRMRPAVIAMMVAAVFLSRASDAQDRVQVEQRTAPRLPGGTVGTPRPDPTTGQPRRPARDPRQPPAEGTATIRGRVIDGATGQAIPRAKVRTMGGPRQARVATTDAEGVFTLTKVPSGSLTLMVEKATYLQALYPDRRRTLRVSSLSVTDGQTVDNINIPLYRGGAITGRVVDAYGDPVENAMVQAVLAPQNNRTGGSSRGIRSTQNTNDIGEFRIGRLEPGQYYLLALPQRRGMMEDDGTSASARTWYPGVASIEQAQPITLERGSSMAGIDFQMLETTLTKVSGYVLNTKGGPAKGGHVSVRTTGASKGMPQGWGGGGPDAGGSSVDQNGNFDLLLQPGEYMIEAMAPQGGEEGQRQGRMEMDRGQVRLSVGTEPISGLAIPTGTGGTVSGRFVFKGAGTGTSTSTPVPTSFAGFNVNFTGPTGGMMGPEDCRNFNRPTVNADGTFSADNMWGTCQIRGGGSAKGWTFEAVMHNGNNITNRVIEFGTGKSISGVEVVYTDRVGEINVTVTDDGGQQTQDYVTVAIPVEKEKWGDQRFVRTQVMSAQQAQQANAMAPGAAGVRITSNTIDSGPFGMGMPGGNTLRNLLAGDYLVVALDDAAFEDLRDPDYLERLAQIATRVSLSPGESQAVQLRRVKAPE